MQTAVEMFLHWDEEVRNYEQMKVGGELLNFSQRKLLLLDQVDINLTKMFCDLSEQVGNNHQNE